MNRGRNSNSPFHDATDSLPQATTAGVDQCLSGAVHDRAGLALGDRCATHDIDLFRYLAGGRTVDPAGLSAHHYRLGFELGSLGRHAGPQKDLRLRIFAPRPRVWGAVG